MVINAIGRVLDSSAPKNTEAEYQDRPAAPEFITVFGEQKTAQKAPNSQIVKPEQTLIEGSTKGTEGVSSETDPALATMLPISKGTSPEGIDMQPGDIAQDWHALRVNARATGRKVESDLPVIVENQSGDTVRTVAAARLPFEAQDPKPDPHQMETPSPNLQGKIPRLQHWPIDQHAVSHRETDSSPSQGQSTQQMINARADLGVKPFEGAKRPVLNAQIPAQHADEPTPSRIFEPAIFPASAAAVVPSAPGNAQQHSQIRTPRETTAVTKPVSALSSDFLMGSPAIEQVDLSPAPRLDEASLVRHQPFPTGTQPHSPMLQVTHVRSIALQMAEGTLNRADGTFEISLNPEELGRVKITLTPTDGRLALLITAERTETLELMRRHAEDLNRAFDDIGYSERSFEFSHDAENPQKKDQEAQDIESILLPLETSAPGNAQPIAHSGVDIRL